MDKDMERKRILVIEEASLAIKKVLSQAILNKEAKSTLRSKCSSIINSAEHKLVELDTDKEFINDTIRGLKSSFLRWYNQVIAHLERVSKADKSGIVSQTLKKIKGIKTTKNTNAFVIGGTDKVGMEKIRITNLRELLAIYDEGAAGLYVNYVDEIKKAIMNIHDDLASSTLSLYDSMGRNKSLRNMAEIKTRYELISEDFKNLKDKGTKFVVSSSHANASERCSWWQGKIFLIDLDVASRKMAQYPGHKPSQHILGYIDGKPYYSLKEACENGFLGYNCQHRLVAYYKGIHIPKYSIAEVNRRRGISQRQRYLENCIRKEKTKQILAIRPEERKKARLKSKELQERYADFCKMNDVPRYDWRTSITEVERNFNPKLNLGFIFKEETGVDAKSILLQDKIVEFKPAKSVLEAENYAIEELKIPLVKYNGIAVETANAMNQSFQELLQYCPEAKEKLKAIGSAQVINKLMRKDVEQAVYKYVRGKFGNFCKETEMRDIVLRQVKRLVPSVEPEVYGFARKKINSGIIEIDQAFNKYTGIFVNVNFGKNYDNFTESIKWSVQLKFHPVGTDTVKAVFDHECGHILDYQYGLRDMPEIKNIFDSYQKNDIMKLKEDLSEYSYNNNSNNKYAEMIAEAYSEYKNNPNPREIATKIGGIIEKKSKERKL